MIRLNGVTKAYATDGDANVVLDNITVDIPTDRSVGILGLNGAGKSTLMRIISGADAPDFGYIERNCFVSWPIGLNGGMQGSLSGRDNVRFVAKLYGVDDIEAVEDYVETFAELGRYYDMPVKTYSSGMKQRLAFGASFAVAFDVYLIDEGIGAGDKRFKDRVTQVFQDRASRASMLIVSHNENLVRKHCQSGALLEAGKLTFYDDINTAIEAYHAHIDDVTENTA